MFRIDQLAVLIPSATKLAEEERRSFNGIYKIIEDIISKENVIYGGNWGIKLLTNQPKGINDYQYELYSEKAEDVAFSIVNEICKKETQFVSLKKELSDFVLYIEARLMVTIHKLKEHDRGIIRPLRIDNTDKLHYIKYKGSDKPTKHVSNAISSGKWVMPPDYHLLDLYRKLYQPVVDDWEVALPLEEELFRMVKFEFNKNQRSFVTGSAELDSAEPEQDKLSDDDSNESGESNKLNSSNQWQIRLELYNRLIKYLSSRTDIAFVGEYACNMLVSSGGRPPDGSSKNGSSKSLHLHIISTLKVAEELNVWIRKVDDPQLKTLIKTNNVQLLNDIRLSRTTIYVVINNEKYPILYVYNSAEHDLIPFNKFLSEAKSRGNIGNPFVIMRFLLVEIWIIKVIREIGGIEEKYAFGKLLDLYKLFMSVRENLKINEKNVSSEETNIWGVFNTPELNGQRYMGSYFSDQHSRKQQMRQKFVKEYTPAAYSNSKGGNTFAKNFNDIFDSKKGGFSDISENKFDDWVNFEN